MKYIYSDTGLTETNKQCPCVRLFIKDNYPFGYPPNIIDLHSRYFISFDYQMYSLNRLHMNTEGFQSFLILLKVELCLGEGIRYKKKDLIPVRQFQVPLLLFL